MTIKIAGPYKANDPAAIEAGLLADGLTAIANVDKQYVEKGNLYVMYDE